MNLAILIVAAVVATVIAYLIYFVVNDFMWDSKQNERRKEEKIKEEAIEKEREEERAHYKDFEEKHRHLIGKKLCSIDYNKKKAKLGTAVYIVKDVLFILLDNGEYTHVSYCLWGWRLLDEVKEREAKEIYQKETFKEIVGE